MTTQTVHIYSTNDSFLAEEPQVFTCAATAMSGYYRCLLIEHPDTPLNHYFIHREQ